MTIEEEIKKLEPLKKQIQKIADTCNDFKQKNNEMENKIDNTIVSITKKVTSKKILLGIKKSAKGWHSSENVFITDIGIGYKPAYGTNLSYCKSFEQLKDAVKDVDETDAMIRVNDTNKAILLQNLILFIQNTDIKKLDTWNVQTRKVKIPKITLGKMDIDKIFIGASNISHISDDIMLEDIEFYILIEKHFDKVLSSYNELKNIFITAYEKQKAVYNSIIDTFGYLLIAEAL